jgi:hypothetical protein
MNTDERPAEVKLALMVMTARMKELGFENVPAVIEAYIEELEGLLYESKLEKEEM